MPDLTQGGLHIHRQGEDDFLAELKEAARGLLGAGAPPADPMAELKAAQRFEKLLAVLARRFPSGDVQAQAEDENEAWAVVKTFHPRLTEAERRIDRVLTRLDVGA
jgi:hypothetical protein